MAQRVAMIGDVVSLAPFASLGVQTYEASTRDEMVQAFDEIMSDEFAVVFVTEEVYEVLERTIARFATETLPAITIIPSVTSARGIGGTKIDVAIERALGAPLPAREEA
ncbi:MAG: hypothetical protein FWG78_01510 [Coriobacteriia bacterium]|nr:hypothetical protein [Coriobacteriia bacterium]